MARFVNGLCWCSFFCVLIPEELKVKYTNIHTIYESKESLRLVYIEVVNLVFPLFRIKVYMNLWAGTLS